MFVQGVVIWDPEAPRQSGASWGSVPQQDSGPAGTPPLVFFASSSSDLHCTCLTETVFLPSPG